MKKFTEKSFGLQLFILCFFVVAAIALASAIIHHIQDHKKVTQEKLFYRNQLAECQAKKDLLADEVTDLRTENSVLQRAQYQNDLSYENTYNFVWHVRANYDFGGTDYALREFRKILDYEPTAAEIDGWLESSFVHMMYPVEDPSREKIRLYIKAEMLDEAFGLAQQIAYQGDTYEALYAIVAWAWENAPAAFNLDEIGPMEYGVSRLSDTLQRSWILLAESDRKVDLALVSRILRETPAEQRLFLCYASEEPQLLTYPLLAIQRFSPSVKKLAIQRGIAEWKSAKEASYFDEHYLDNECHYDDTRTHREVLREILRVKV